MDQPSEGAKTEADSVNLVLSGYMFECLKWKPVCSSSGIPDVVPVCPVSNSLVLSMKDKVLPLQFHLRSKCQDCLEECNLHRHKGGSGLHTA